MSTPEKIQLWRELSGYSRALKSSCDDLMKRDIDEENQYCIVQLRQTSHSFREAFALIHLLRKQSNLLEGLIDHDFLNRFASINFLLEASRNTLNAERLERICEVVWIFSEVVESLIFWINNMEARLEKVYLDEYILNVRKKLQRSFTKMELATKIEDKDLPVLLHPPTLTNLIINMIINAQKHADATKVEFVSERKHEKVQLIVQDNGKGFQVPYDKMVPGLGLLKIDERLKIMNASLQVEEHGGIGQGAAFRISFPKADQSSWEVKVKLPKADEEE